MSYKLTPSIGRTIKVCTKAEVTQLRHVSTDDAGNAFVFHIGINPMKPHIYSLISQMICGRNESRTDFVIPAFASVFLFILLRWSSHDKFIPPLLLLLNCVISAGYPP